MPTTTRTADTVTAAEAAMARRVARIREARREDAADLLRFATRTAEDGVPELSDEGLYLATLVCENPY